MTLRSDQADIFAVIFEWFDLNFKLDDKGHLRPDFPRLNEQNFSNIFINVEEVSWFIKILDPEKATVTNKIPVAILKNINPELFTISAKLFNRRMKEKTLTRSQVYAWFRSVQVRSLLDHNINPSVSSMSLGNALKV